MMTVEISDEEHWEWLTCEFCGEKRKVPFQAHTAWKGTDKETVFPAADFVICGHYWLDKKESFGLGPCPTRDHWKDTEWELRDRDTGAVRKHGTVTFDERLGWPAVTVSP